LGAIGRGETDGKEWSYIGGQMVLLSQNLIQWISSSEIPLKNIIGDEDR
jgi:hypothetical protein